MLAYGFKYSLSRENFAKPLRLLKSRVSKLKWSPPKIQAGQKMQKSP